MMTRTWSLQGVMVSNVQPKEKTITKSHSPVLDRRAVLLDHLAAILESIQPGKSNDRVCRKLQTLSDRELLEMLCVREKLEKFIAAIETESVSTATQTTNQNFELLGNLLFDKVAKFETELCAQVTGMILEMDPVLIEELLSDSSALQMAVTKAKEEYIKANYPDRFARETNIADDVYRQVHNLYPSNAPQITGMLLELPASSLHHLLCNPGELCLKVDEAKQALENVNKWVQE